MVREVMRSRRSVRRYRVESVPLERVVRVLEAGSYAPSGANRQPWVYMVVDDDGLKGEIRRRAEAADRIFHREAP
ncbi:MAG: nitroreductase family protein, partial [Candidatus Bathyarchaeia archaeon]